MDFKTILPSGSTGYERALEAASGERWAALDVGLIRDFKNPWACPPHLLNFLAFERSVDIWNTDWDDLKKRSVIDSAPADHRLKGTRAGIRRYIEILDGELIQTVVPPDGFFAAPGLTKAELDAHIARHPKVRVSLARGEGEWHYVDAIFADAGFCGEATTGIDDGRALYRRQAWLVEDGVSTPLLTTQLVEDTEDRTGTRIERVTVPGHAVAFAFVSEFVADDSFADAWDVPPEAFTYALPRGYSHDASRLELSMLPVGYQPRDVRYQRESETGAAGPYFFDSDFSDDGFAGDNDAPDLIADVLRLYDPDIASPIVNSGGFADVSRVSVPAHTAEMLVDWNGVMTAGSAIVADYSFAGDDPAEPNDTTRRDAFLGAIDTASRLSDRVLVTFQTRRERTLADGIRLDQPARLDERVPHIL